MTGGRPPHHARIAPEVAAGAPDRFELWKRIIRDAGVRTVAEIGVQRGAFAAAILEACPSIERYRLVDPWRELPDWNKPVNRPTGTHEEFLRETLRAIAPHAARCEVFAARPSSSRPPSRGRPGPHLPIDGDHTLRGIVIDLIRLWPKARLGALRRLLRR